ncbi:hypothetical protein [uncultured Methanobrevibacter sp.]|uniref:hypothetical protein n=1 Tax=uncultured Methanobrevibacter sp. TaxID=253161 RepID=UPI0025F7EEA6|nr:hypothetical protein [uncultured Methanobrevibacter sp.]
MNDDKSIDLKTENTNLTNELIVLRRKYKELDEDRHYVKSLLDAEFEKGIELKKENEQLKSFKEKVFVLLDEKIKHYEHKPFSAPVGQPMSVNFDADVDRLARLSELQDLEKELQE